MSGVMERTLRILELLAGHPDGLPISAIASALDMPVSAAHRMLKELSEHGYVRQMRAQGDYALTIRLAALGLGFLGKTGVTDIAQPILDRLAAESRELVRLSVIDGSDLVWVAVAQGATSGLRYDPGREQGVVVHLATSAGGRAWLGALSDDEALALIARQGLEPPFPAGPGAPKTLGAVLEELAAARRRGYAVAVDSYIDGMAAMAVPIFAPGDCRPIGCLSIAGPAVRLTAERQEALSASLKAAAAEIGDAAAASSYFARDRALPGRVAAVASR
jgi:DNA-binding IclR family transcriptional regulator